MSMSSFFRNLRTAYQAEIDDLRSDSEGRDVLRHRLAEKRSQMAFLRQMIEINPEMVAAAFHGGFHFELPAALEHVLTLEPEDFPAWDSLADAVQLAPWAQELADEVLQEPRGEWFLTVAAALEYLLQRPSSHHHGHGDEAHEQGEDEAAHGKTRRRDHDHGHDFDADDEQHHDVDHDEASANWLEGQGFDRKE